MTRERKLDGQYVPVDEAFDAWGSGDLERMLRALGTESSPLDRHFLLIGIVEQAWRKRTAPGIAVELERCAHLHIDEFDQLLPTLSRNLPNVNHQPAYDRLIALLIEQGRLTEAEALCEQAVTVSDAPIYRSRLKTIRSKMKKSTR